LDAFGSREEVSLCADDVSTEAQTHSRDARWRSGLSFIGDQAGSIVVLIEEILEIDAAKFREHLRVASLRTPYRPFFIADLLGHGRQLLTKFDRYRRYALSG
jgi:hypothetical protein